jgi:tRNA threonylcarbamoyladenosine biosynthesis protein TsaB
MKILAIDTATEQCSAALWLDGAYLMRLVPTARSHSELVLPMIEELLKEATLRLSDLDGIAFGRGPGSFTGVRIAVSVAQGLGLATGLPLLPISNLQAVAQQEITSQSLSIGSTVLVCMDARMQEVYWAIYKVDDSHNAVLCGSEHVSPPTNAIVETIHNTASHEHSLQVAVGTGWDAYPKLREHFPVLKMGTARLPRASDIAVLALASLRAGLGVSAAAAQPIYLRDNVTYAAK